MKLFKCSGPGVFPGKHPWLRPSLAEFLAFKAKEKRFHKGFISKNSAKKSYFEGMLPGSCLFGCECR